MKDKKYQVFRKYADNLNLIKSLDSVRVEPNVEDVYLCPTCFRIFDESALNTEEDLYLSWEDVPPKSIGGKKIILTCSECNNVSGSVIDWHLKEKEDLSDFLSVKPNLKRNVKFDFEGKVINGNISFDEEKRISFNFIREISNPANYDISMDHFQRKEGSSIKFKLDLRDRSKTRLANLSLIRAAYLWFFYQFGYYPLLTKTFQTLRFQIMNPSLIIIPDNALCKYNGLKKEHVGLNVVTEPKELRCFMVGFQVRKGGTTKVFGVLLPGFDDENLSIYGKKDILEKYNGFKFRNYRVENDISHKESLFTPFKLWQKAHKNG